MSRISKIIEEYGIDPNGKNVIKLHFECDTVSDLPTTAEAATANIVMALGSDAHIIQDDTKYMIKGDGVWVKQKGEFELSLDAAAIDYDNTTSGMTADNIQDAIDEIHAATETLTVVENEDRAALIAQVDSGAKNILPQNDISGTGGWASDVSCLIPAGDYVIFFGSLSSTDTDATTCQLGFFDKSYNSAVAGGAYPQIARGTNISLPVKLENNVVKFRLYSSNTVAHGSGDTVTATNIMICTAADWAISQKFVPYAPTNRELYEMILQLQSAAGLRTVSTLRSAAAPLENKIEEEVTEDEER